MLTELTSVDGAYESNLHDGWKLPVARPAPVLKLVRVSSVANGTAMMPDGASRFGNYVLEERVAIGGMAEVFRARRLGAAGFSRTVCIKRILPTFCQDKHFVEMFIDEANTGAQLRHSNIVAIDDFGEIDGRYFLAMEFIQGVDASKLITALAADRRSLPWEVGAFMLREVLSALDYAHRKKAPDGGPLYIVHRDVSPHNVLLSTAGEVKLTDFGIARARTRIHQTNAHVVKGKLAYMAPEQARAQPLDGRADLFAAGVSAYEWLANQRPFNGKNDPEIVSNLLKGRRDKLRALRPDIPDALESVIDGLLEVDRDRRIESAAAALALLDPLVSPSAGRRLSAIVTHYFFPHLVTSVGQTFSPDKLPPAPVARQAAPIVPVAPASPSTPPAPRLSLNAPARVEQSADTQIVSASPSSRPSYPSLSEGSEVSISIPIEATLLVARDGSTAISDVLEAAPVCTESRPVVRESCETTGDREASVRPQEMVTRTSLRPVSDLSPSHESVAPVTISAAREDVSPLDAKENGTTERRVGLVLVLGAAVIIVSIALALVRSGCKPAANVRPTEASRMADRLVARAASEPARVQPPTVIDRRPVTAPVASAEMVTETPRITATSAADTGGRVRRNVSGTRAVQRTPDAVGLGTLAVQALPWAELTIDGANDGITPIYRRINAGTHRITLVHPPTGRRAMRVVTVRPGEVTRLLVELR